MSNFKEMNKEVYYVTGSIAKLSKEDIDFLKEKMASDNLQRIRICSHKDINDNLHEMFIVHKKGTYVRPHKHLNKSESAHIIEGSAYFIVFDDKGSITDVTEVGDYSSGYKFYYRVADAAYHTLFITSDYLVFHETTKGPFKKLDSEFAPWSPDDNGDVKKFMNDLTKSIENYEQNNSP